MVHQGGHLFAAMLVKKEVDCSKRAERRQSVFCQQIRQSVCGPQNLDDRHQDDKEQENTMLQVFGIVQACPEAHWANRPSIRVIANQKKLGEPEERHGWHEAPRGASWPLNSGDEGGEAPEEQKP